MQCCQYKASGQRCYKAMAVLGSLLPAKAGKYRSVWMGVNVHI
jgi:hypothetical protein